MRLVIAGRRHGPYHHARFAAVAAYCDLVALEFSRRDKVNLWDYIPETRGFRQVTLFTDETDVDDRARVETRRAVQRALNEINPAVVAVPGWSHPGALACLQWCLRRRRAAVLLSDSTAHDQPRVCWQEAIKRRVVRLFDAALVAGAASRAYVRSLGLPDEAIFEGYDVVDNAHFAGGAEAARYAAARLRAELGLPERFFLAIGRFIGTGRDAGVKNHFRLLDAYARYRRRAGADAWKLVLLGDGDQRDALERHRRSLGFEGDVQMPGCKQYNELPSYYGLASAFVHPSLKETWALVVNEAMAAGLPVLVSTRCGCAPDLVRNGVNGYTFDPYEIRRMAKLMARVADMADEERMSMGRMSQTIISTWGLAHLVDGLLKAVQVAVQRRRAHPGYLDNLMLEALIRR